MVPARLLPARFLSVQDFISLRLNLRFLIDWLIHYSAFPAAKAM